MCQVPVTVLVLERFWHKVRNSVLSGRYHHNLIHLANQLSTLTLYEKLFCSISIVWGAATGTGAIQGEMWGTTGGPRDTEERNQW